MDDIGSEQLCKLSCNQNQNSSKNEQINVILNCDTSTPITTSLTLPTIAPTTGTSLDATTTITTPATAVTSSSPITTVEEKLGGVQNRMIIVKKPKSNNKSNIKNLNSVTEEGNKMMYNKNSTTPVTATTHNASTSTTNSSNNSLPLMDVATTSVANSYPYSSYSYDNDNDNNDRLYPLEMATAITTTSSIDEDSDEKEKTDVTPENVKKLDDVIAISNSNNNSNSHNEMSGSSSRSKQKTTTKMKTITAGENSNNVVGGGDDDGKNDDNIELKIIEDESPTKQCLAFTIQFTNEGEASSSSTAARYKNMVERFQNRHRRGASLSKLDDGYHNQNQNSSNTGRTSRVMSAQHQRQLQHQNSDNNNSSEANKVKLRIRERSTSGVRDASKRHSWSPRSSTHEPLELQTQHQITRFREKQQISKGTISGGGVVNDTGSNFHMNSRQNIKSTKKVQQVNLLPPRAEKNLNNLTSHSNALQMKTLNKLEFLCPEPPLNDFIKKTKCDDNVDDDDDCETVSEAGTYTVDGDNYTEEQKEQMNIDKSMNYTITESTSEQISDLVKKKTIKNQTRPNELSLHHIATNNNINCNLDNQKQNNILEINYYHDSTSLKPKISYLEKIKSKVRNITTKSTSDKKLNSPSDIGMFTSVTTSGVLSIKPTLDSYPKVNRRNSLTKSQVDSSEYVSASENVNFKNSSIGNISNSGSGGGGVGQQSPYPNMADHQKAEYKLNLFTATNQTDSQILKENYGNNNVDHVITATTPDSPTANQLYTPQSIISETIALKTAQSKNDWIQEWARNARARSQSATTTVATVGGNTVAAISKIDCNNEQMSRSYNFETIIDSTGYSGDEQIMNNSAIMYRNKGVIDRFRNHGIGDYEYSSDPNVSAIKAINGGNNSGRPPMSPSKIPSPMHSIGRARSVSRTRGSLQDLSPLKTTAATTMAQTPDNTDIYLQKTAAAISNLTQSFSRKNSLQSTASTTAAALATTKSPPSSSAGNSPRHHIFPQHYSADEYSPTHTARHHYNNHHSSGHHHHHNNAPNVHKRNLSLDYRNNLMSHSLNTETLAAILSNDKKRTNERNQNQSNRSTRQHSYDGITGYGSPKLFQRKNYIDQTIGSLSSSNKQQFHQQQQQQSPIRRSSSFSTRPLSSSSGKQQHIISGNSRSTHSSIETTQNPIQKSASSTSFRKVYSDYDDSIAYYINDEDNLIDAEYCGSSDDYDDSDHGECYASQQPPPPPPALASEQSEPLTNTRYNKALLMRIERSKQRVSGTQKKPSTGGGVMACPNTPEMPRRAAVQNSRPTAVRQSVPRDSSLSRLKAEIPNSLASAKKHLLQTAAAATTSPSSSHSSTNANKKIQPKYMDISKYKPVQGANFLRKNETKSTLINRSNEIKRSPSSVSVQLNRSDAARTSNRSIKSASSRSSGSKREQSVPKQKEVELAMWKRRATYDPMKSAAEDRKRKEEAKRLSQLQGKSTESSSVVSRSQSFHSGVTLTSSSSSSTTATTTATAIGNFRERLNHRADHLKFFKMDENDDIIDNDGDDDDDDEDLNVNNENDDDDDDDFIEDNAYDDDVDQDDDQNKLITKNRSSNKNYRWTLIPSESNDGNDDDDINVNNIRDNNNDRIKQKKKFQKNLLNISN